MQVMQNLSTFKRRLNFSNLSTRSRDMASRARDLFRLAFKEKHKNGGRTGSPCNDR